MKATTIRKKDSKSLFLMESLITHPPNSR